MFLISVNHSKKKLAMIILGLIVTLIIGTVIFIFCKNKTPDYAISSQGSYNLKAGNREERIEFLAQFGWQVEPEEIEICDIIIPNSFNKIFEDYNEVQKQQGLDLSNYMGKTCKRFTYKITNYPNNINDVYADLLILDATVIGGDVCSAEQGGFLHNFFNPTNTNENQNSSTETGALLYPVENSNAINSLAFDSEMPNAPID